MWPAVLPEQQLDLVKLSFQITPSLERWHPNFKIEALWCLPHADFFVVRNVPLFVHGLAYDDVVRVHVDDAKQVASFECISGAQSSTLWLDFTAPRHATSVSATLVSLGCTIEDFTGSRFHRLGVNVPTEVNAEAVDEFLAGHARAGLFQVTIAKLGSSEIP